MRNVVEINVEINAFSPTRICAGAKIHPQGSAAVRFVYISFGEYKGARVQHVDFSGRGVVDFNASFPLKSTLFLHSVPH